jgi:hypothetical protein
MHGFTVIAQGENSSHTYEKQHQNFFLTCHTIVKTDTNENKYHQIICDPSGSSADRM